MGNILLKLAKNKMKFIKTEIPDVYIIEPSVFGDNRGYFLESFNLENLKKISIL